MGWLSWSPLKVPAILPTIANVNTMKNASNILILWWKVFDFVKPQGKILGTQRGMQNLLWEQLIYRFKSKIFSLYIIKSFMSSFICFSTEFPTLPTPSHTWYQLIPSNSLYMCTSLSFHMLFLLFRTLLPSFLCLISCPSRLSLGVIPSKELSLTPVRG